MFAATPGALAGAWIQETKRQLQLIGGSFQHYLAGGDWNHGILNDFPFSWELNVIIPTDELTPSFFRGVNHQPVMALSEKLGTPQSIGHLFVLLRK